MTTIKFPGLTRLDLPCDRILNGALEADLESVLAIGFRKNGEFYFASSLADGGNVAWLLTRALHNLHQQADALEGAERSTHSEGSGDVVPMPLAAPQPCVITIHKPRAPEKLPGGGNKWADACSGRLVLGTGCGACLRCNREWFAVLRQHGNQDAWSPAAQSVVQDITLSPDQVQAALERAPETVSAKAVDNLLADADEGRNNALDRLTNWVDDWNRASAVGDQHAVRMLDITLRNMVFPEGVELVDEFIIDSDSPRKRIIHAQKPQA